MLIEVIKNIIRKPSTKKAFEKPKRGFRGIIEINKEKCVGCGLCERICPSDAIKVVKGKAEYKLENCTFCGFCIRVCPVNAIKATERYEVIEK